MPEKRTIETLGQWDQAEAEEEKREAAALQYDTDVHCITSGQWH